MRPSPSSAVETGPRRRRVVWAVLTLALSLAALGVSATGAIFTDSDAVTGNEFVTGTVALDASPTSSLVAFSGGMAPGDSTSGELTVSNSGSLELRYALTSTTDEDALAAQLEMWVWAESDEVDALPNTSCDTAPGANVASYIYEQLDLGSTGGTNIIGDPTQGSQTGDRTLAASANELLCFYVELPVGTGNAFQGLTTTATFDIASEQVANNA